MKINRFQLETEIGRGGMGVVYRAMDPVLKRPVALKLLAPHLGGNSDALARFHREAELVAGLKHPHIAMVYEFGEYQDQPYMAMEWIEGQNLRNILNNEGPLSLERSLALFYQLTDALDYAHQKGVIHRDLKPSNIIVDASGQAAIVDFGLAWLENAPSITLSGSILGTPRYMSPEQIEGGAVDNRADLYSLAVILYEMLAGQPPFDNAKPSALLHRQLFLPPPPITEINPALPANMETVLNKGLSKKPAERYQTAHDFQTTLQTLAPTLTDAPAIQHPGKSMWQALLKHKWLLVGGIIGAALIVSAILTLPNLFSKAQDILPNRALPAQTASTATPPVDNPDNIVPESVDPPPENQVWGAAAIDSTQTHFLEMPFPRLEPEPRWIQYPDGSPQTHLVAGNGLIIVALNEGIVQALDWTTGEPVWETRLGVEISASPSLYAGDETTIVLLPTSDGALYALDVTDARLIWRIGNEELAGVIQGITPMYEDVSLVVTGSGQTYAIDALSGEIYGMLDLGAGHPISHPPAVNDTAVFLAAESGTLFAFELRTESIAWEGETIGRPSVPPLGDNGWGYSVVGTDEGFVHAFSSLSGQIVWQFQLDSPIAGLAADWDQLYVASAEGVIYAWDIWGDEQMWETELETTITAGPIVNGKIVLLGSEDGEIIYLNAENGQMLSDRSLFTEDAVRSLAPAGNWLFVATDDGIYAFSAAGADAP